VAVFLVGVEGIADAVAVGVRERADVQAVEDGILVPEVVDHRGHNASALLAGTTYGRGFCEAAGR